MADTKILEVNLIYSFPRVCHGACSQVSSKMMIKKNVLLYIERVIHRSFKRHLFSYIE